MSITITEATNQFVAKFAKEDAQFDSAVDSILEKIAILDQECANTSKYDAVVSIEYYLFKIRVDVEFTHLKVKRCLSDVNTPSSLRSALLKRDQYLAQVILKLNAIRDDVSALQKVVYTQQTRQFTK